MQRRLQGVLKAALLCAAFCLSNAHMIALSQDGGAHLIGQFNAELPLRDLAINCGSSQVFLFGDTFSTVSPTVTGWRPNTGARLADGRLIALNNDQALWYPDGDASASVPSGCVTIGGVMVAFYTDVSSNTGHDFQAVSSGVVVSSDGGATWVKHRLFEGDGSRAQAAFAVTGDGYVYLLMTGAGRVGAATLARTHDLLDAAVYTWWDGVDWGAWESAAVVIPGQVGEASIYHNGDSASGAAPRSAESPDAESEWLVAYLDPSLNGVVLRRSPSLVGAWGEAEMLVDWDIAHGTYAPQFLDCGRFLLSHFESNTINGLTYPAYAVYEWGL
jgi:uncharacterized protein DUF4185